MGTSDSFGWYSTTVLAPCGSCAYCLAAWRALCQLLRQSKGTSPSWVYLAIQVLQGAPLGACAEIEHIEEHV